MSKQSYSEKLRDPRWQKLRLEVMQRDNFTCQACRSTDKTLNVNHLVYRGDPWDAPMEHLETLCEDCHERRTILNDVLKRLSTRQVFRMVNAMRNASALAQSAGEFSKLFAVAGEIPQLAGPPTAKEMLEYLDDCIAKAENAGDGEEAKRRLLQRMAIARKARRGDQTEDLFADPAQIPPRAKADEAEDLFA